jgi:hypothetical protein
MEDDRDMEENTRQDRLRRSTPLCTLCSCGAYKYSRRFDLRPINDHTSPINAKHHGVASVVFQETNPQVKSTCAASDSFWLDCSISFRGKSGRFVYRLDATLPYARDCVHTIPSSFVQSNFSPSHDSMLPFHSKQCRNGTAVKAKNGERRSLPFSDKQ